MGEQDVCVIIPPENHAVPAAKTNTGRNLALIIGGGVLTLLLICGVLAAVGRSTPRSQSPQDAAGVAPVTTAAATTPTVETKTVTQTEPIPFPETTVNDT